jgi:hypothetical protein
VSGEKSLAGLVRRTGIRVHIAAACFSMQAIAAYGQTPGDTTAPPTGSAEFDKCQKQALGATMALAVQAMCESIDPTYAQNKSHVDKWLANARTCFGASVPNMTQLREQASSQIAAQTAEQKQRARKECADHALEIAAQFRPTNPIYADPGATWKEFRAALVARDRERALRCLATLGTYAEIIHAMPDAELASFGRSLADVKATDASNGDYVEAVTETTGPDGTKHDGLVLFAKINGNWLIGSF